MNETFSCGCKGKVTVITENTISHCCKHLASVKQFGDSEISYKRVQINPKLTNGETRYNWFVDWLI